MPTNGQAVKIAHYTRSKFNSLTNKDSATIYYVEEPNGEIKQYIGNTHVVSDSVPWTGVSGKPSFATVATSGSYNDLSNKPTIPAAQVAVNWNSTSGITAILNKPNLATVATSGSYADLSNKPSIPSKVSDLTNDSGYTTKSHVDTSVNELNITIDSLGNHVDSGLANKVDKVTGKGLSTNDYTTTEKNKLAGIASGAQVNVGTNLSQGARSTTTLRIDSSTGNNLTLPAVTTALAGLMTSTDKTRLDVLHSLLEENTSNNVVDSINEVLAIFNNYPEGADLVTALAGKVDKVSGKGLSTNDYTTTEKNKLSGIETGATNLKIGTTSTTAKAGNYHPTWSQVTNKPTDLVYTADLTTKANDNEVVKLSGTQTISGEKTFSSPTTFGYNTGHMLKFGSSSGEANVRTSSGKLMLQNNGMSSYSPIATEDWVTATGKAADSGKLNGLELNSTTTNNQANKVMRTDGSGYANFGWVKMQSGNTTSPVTDVYIDIGDGWVYKKPLASFKEELGSMPSSWSQVTSKPSFATVATSGSYADLSNKPSIPSKVSDLTNDSGYTTKSHVDTSVNELNITIDSLGNHVDSGLQTKQSTITGAATTITSSNLATNRALISNGSGKVAVSAVTSTELGYLDGVTSGIQGQLNSKMSASDLATALKNLPNI